MGLFCLCQNSELDNTFKIRKPSHENLNLWLPLLEEQMIQEPGAHIPPGLGNSHILWSGPGQSAGLLQTPLFPSVDPGLFITPALPARPL